MKHHKNIRKLGRVRKQRTALLRSLARSMIIRGKIETTEAKAKELRPFLEKLITKSKEDTISARRLVSSRLGSEKEATSKLFTSIAPEYKDRKGGYTRITKVPPRKGDAAKMAVVEFI